MKRMFIVLILASLMLFGCTSIGDALSGSSGTSSVTKSSPYAPSVPVAAPQAYVTEYSRDTTTNVVVDTQMLVKTGSATIKVPENTLEARVDAMKTMLKSEGATLSDVRFYEYSDRKQYTITIKATPTRFEGIVARLKDYGEVKDLSVSTEDVGQQYHDLDIRITNRQIELSRLYQLYNASADVKDLLSVEQEITRVETDLDVLKAQKQELDRQISKSTLAITIYEDKPATSKIEMSLGDLATAFLGALWAGVMLLMLGVGFFLPLAIIVIVAYIIWKKMRRKKIENEGSIGGSAQGNNKKK